jgi:hypothetical protein
MAARTAQPGNAHAIAHGQAVDVGTHLVDDADDLVPGHERQLGFFQIAADNVQVGSAQATCCRAKANLRGTGLGRRDVAQVERLALPLANHGAHDGLGIRRVRHVDARN